MMKDKLGILFLGQLPEGPINLFSPTPLKISFCHLIKNYSEYQMKENNRGARKISEELSTKHLNRELSISKTRCIIFC